MLAMLLIALVLAACFCITQSHRYGGVAFTLALLSVFLALPLTARAHGVPVVRSQVVVSYQPVVQVQAYAAPVVVQQAVAYPVVQAVAVQPVCVQAVQAYAVQQVQAVHSCSAFAVRQQVIQQVRPPPVFQRQVIRSRTIVR